MANKMRIRFRKILVVAVVGFLFVNVASAQEQQDKPALDTQPSVQKTGMPVLKLDFPLFDLPYQIDAMDASGYGFFGSYTSVSMDQALALSTDIYFSMHYGLKKLYDSLTVAPMWKNAIYYSGTAAGILVFAYVLPFGYPWAQKEFTRSILSRFDIKSINGDYNIFNPTQVIGVTDAQLEQFKAKSPQDMIRMDTAGSEGYILFSDFMLRNVFFYGLENLSNWTALFAAAAGGIGYNAPSVLADTLGENYIDNDIKAAYKDDGNEESRQLYFISSFNWAYDLFRPDEPYSGRGTHPSGNGIARYITWSQLNDDERQYLIKQGWLSYLNLISPLYYGFNSFPLGKTGLEWNFALRHYLTSFGSDVPVQLLLKKAPFNMLFTYHSYQNYSNYFPAVEAELVDFPLRLGSLDLFLSPRILVGMQPADQEFMTADSEFMGLFGLRADFGISKHFLPYIDVTAKTDGWVAGNEYLEANASVRLGLSMRF
jgi:hypothetical protein